jgi:hypothetical protein
MPALLDADRRDRVQTSAVAGLSPLIPAAAVPGEAPLRELTLRVNGREHRFRADLRTTLLDRCASTSGSPARRRAATSASAAPARSWSTAAASTPA